MRIFKPNNSYNVESKMRKAKYSVYLWVALLIFMMISPFLIYFEEIVITEGLTDEKKLEYYFFSIFMIVIILMVIKGEHNSYLASGIVTKADNNGIYSWNEMKKEEVNRIKFRDIQEVYWDPSHWYSFITVLVKDTEGNINLKTIIKGRMENQSKIKMILENKIERFHNKRIEDHIFKEFRTESKKRKRLNTKTQ